MEQFLNFTMFCLSVLGYGVVFLLFVFALSVLVIIGNEIANAVVRTLKNRNAYYNTPEHNEEPTE